MAYLFVSNEVADSYRVRYPTDPKYFFNEIAHFFPMEVLYPAR